MRCRILLVVLAAGGVLWMAALAAQPAGPSLVVLNARVFTGVPTAPWAQALSIVGERIGVVGTTAAVRDLATASTRVIDAGGRLVVPGINDAHVHVGASPPSVQLAGPPAMEQDPSLADVVERLKAALPKAAAGTWIVGEIGARVLDDPKATRFVLDAVAGTTPVMLWSWTGHGTFCNTAALRVLGVQDEEPDPPGGFFVRMPGTTTITGIAHEYAEYILRRRASLLATAEAQAAAVRSMAAQAAGWGITSLQLMTTGEDVAALARTVAAADVPQRVRLIDFPMTGMASWREPARAAGAGPRVAVAGTKWILDGTPVERLMFLRQPYADRPDLRGRLNFPAGEIDGFLQRALAARQQPMFHAVGDAAIDAMLDALERTGGAAWQPLRPRLEHGDMFEPAHYDRARRFGVVLVQNPSHFMLPQVMKARLGDRVSRITLMKSALAAGVPVALGSDGPLNPYLNIMFAAVNANNPQEAMTREQALAAYTSGAAYAELQETQKGKISPGMLADVAILSRDIFTVPADALPATESVLTIVGGRVVFEKR